ncbi:protein FANTASTIC FOUR 1-like [Ziziphus jujuba]|uniref:Protein FANTASTIC FOUR 1-like n=1 Tax=Ziziphus jujuba TaxID=326968 RepID=A0A6P4AYD3_ZIZJJ|nr:protein FANTASTIC FOUR 1-like [Ziziphus jujuba]
MTSSSSNSFSSLRDMLKPPPYKRPKSSSSSSSFSSSSLSTPLSEPIEGNYDPFAGLFDNLSVKESSGGSSSLDSFIPPVLSSAASSVSDLSLQTTTAENLSMENSQEEEEEKNKYPNGRTWCVKAGGDPWKTNNNPFPPPISCLKSIKNGKTFAYMKFNEDDKSFVVEEVKIPNRDLLRSSRADGRLKLYLVLSGDDDDDDDYDEATEMEEDEFQIVKADSDEEEEEEDSN